MPYYDFYIRPRRKRSKAGRELDQQYKQHKIGETYYNKIKDKKIYWESA